MTAPISPPATPTSSSPPPVLPQTVTSTVTVTTTQTPAPTTFYPPVDTSPAIVTAAFIAVSGVAVTGLVTWLLGLRSVRAAQKSAEAADRSSKAAESSAIAANKNADASDRSSSAAERSAEAAQDVVGLNRSTAQGAAARAEADARAKRYQDSAAQLGHPEPHVRLAGAYAMSSLADDWPGQRQACVDVLCAYLRLPERKDALGEIDAADQEVRKTIVALIQDHLQRSALPSWSSLSFNFDRAVLRDFQMRSAKFANTASFTRTTFVGGCTFSKTTFGLSLNFDFAVLSDDAVVSLHSTVLAHNTSMTNLRIPATGDVQGFNMKFPAAANSRKPSLALTVECLGRLKLSFSPRGNPGSIEIGDTVVHSGGSLSVRLAKTSVRRLAVVANSSEEPPPEIDVNIGGVLTMQGSKVDLPAAVEATWPANEPAQLGEITFT